MAELKIELITVGDEILLGHTLDINAHWIAGRLAECGLRLRWHSTVGDSASDIRHLLRHAWDRADVVIVTGGLGPTQDDITRQVIAGFFRDDLVEHPELQRGIIDRFAARGADPPPGFEVLAQFPSQAEPIVNEHGSAHGIHHAENSRELFALPGIPFEMQCMVENYVIPAITARRTTHFLSHIFRTTGIGESHLSEKIGDLKEISPVSLAYLPSLDYGVTLRLSVSGGNPDAAREALDNAASHVRGKVKEYIYTEDNRSLAAVIIDILRNRKMKIAVAESCTGGMICDKFVSVPGSSEVFERGLVTYSNESKIELLDVNNILIREEGAVSERVAAAMSEGVLREAGVDIALSVTGISGPTGGSDEKPVGLTYIGLSYGKCTEVKCHRFSGNRDSNRRRATNAALALLWRHLLRLET